MIRQGRRKARGRVAEALTLLSVKHLFVSFSPPPFVVSSSHFCRGKLVSGLDGDTIVLTGIPLGLFLSPGMLVPAYSSSCNSGA